VFLAVPSLALAVKIMHFSLVGSLTVILTSSCSGAEKCTYRSVREIICTLTLVWSTHPNYDLAISTLYLALAIEAWATYAGLRSLSNTNGVYDKL
jgi:hypothetical protein